MVRYFVRTESGWKENLTAAAVAFGAGATVFYFARMLIARESLQAPDRPGTAERESGVPDSGAGTGD